MKLEELGIESEEELKELENNGKLFIYRAPEENHRPNRPDKGRHFASHTETYGTGIKKDKRPEMNSGEYGVYSAFSSFNPYFILRASQAFSSSGSAEPTEFLNPAYP